MIRGISVTTDQPNIEQMFISGEEVGGSGEFFTCNIYREELTPEEQSVYDAGVSVVNDNYYNIINNTVASLTINRITSTVLVEGEDVLDFEALPLEDQDKLRALLALIISKKN